MGKLSNGHWRASKKRVVGQRSELTLVCGVEEKVWGAWGSLIYRCRGFKSLVR
jgi:hypothetical protein